MAKDHFLEFVPENKSDQLVELFLIPAWQSALLFFFVFHFITWKKIWNISLNNEIGGHCEFVQD